MLQVVGLAWDVVPVKVPKHIAEGGGEQKTAESSHKKARNAQNEARDEDNRVVLNSLCCLRLLLHFVLFVPFCG